jgi:methionyl-tRNA synthetase
LSPRYLTVNGTKISKSLGSATDPTEVVERFGADAVRWWLLRDVNAETDTDFRIERLVERHDQDLANGLGNLVNRVLGLLDRGGYDRIPDIERRRHTEGPARDAEEILDRVDTAVDRLDFRVATTTLWGLVEEANAYVNSTRPWELRGDGDRAEFEATLAELLHACRLIAEYLAPFLPAASARVLDACRPGSVTAARTALSPRLKPGTRGT